jgi:sarcosine oxidase subunit alpha
MRTPTCSSSAPARGLTAALTAARAGARVVLVDEQSEAGGSLLGGTASASPHRWVAAAVAELATYPEVRTCSAPPRSVTTTTASCWPSSGAPTTSATRPRHAVPSAGMADPRAARADRDRRARAPDRVRRQRPPGIMLAHSARTFLHRYGVLVGRAAVVFTTNDSAYAAAFDLADAGVRIEAMVDARATCPTPCGASATTGHPVACGAVVDRHSGRRPHHRRLGRGLRRCECRCREAVPCDALLVSGGWNPAVHLFSQARGVLRYDAALGGFVPGEHLAGSSVAGAANGVLTWPVPARRPRRRRSGAVRTRSVAGESLRCPTSVVESRAGLVLWRVPGREQDQFVDVQARRHGRGRGARGWRRHAVGRTHQALHHDRDAHDQARLQG